MRRFSAITAAAVAFLGAAPLPAGDTPVLAVIVHLQRDEEMSVEALANIYLKRQRFWEDGSAILPLNREAGCPEREAFSRRVLHGGSAAFAGYWNEQYFNGVFPPPALSSNEAIRRYVATDRNAIGYVPAAEADDSVRVILRLDGAGIAGADSSEQ